jgi:hypothetical protein
MNLYLRRVDHVQAKDNYRVILKTEEGDLEIGSIGIKHQAGSNVAWTWGIDTVIPMREIESEGYGKDRADCMKRFKAAWINFVSDEARLSEFLSMKRKRSLRSAHGEKLSAEIPGSMMRCVCGVMFDSHKPDESFEHRRHIYAAQAKGSR